MHYNFNMNSLYKYSEATRKNLGWISKDEQSKIKEIKIAVGGLGGVGGDHLETLARLGVTKFHMADLDTFDLGNFNRQSGATVSSIGKTKLETSKKILLDINPNIEVKGFPKGITVENIDEFLEGVDVYIDCLDIFALDIRREVFKACRKKNIPSLSAAPLGFGATLMYFDKDSPSFDEYFGMKDIDESILNSFGDDLVSKYMYHYEIFFENIVRFIVGAGPKAYTRHYLVSHKSVDLFKKDLPSVKMSMNFAAGLMGTSFVKLVLKRGELKAIPHVLNFDAYLNKFTYTYRPFTNFNPLTILTRWLVKKKIKLKERKEDLYHDLIHLQNEGKLDKEITAAGIKAILRESENLPVLEEKLAKVE